MSELSLTGFKLCTKCSVCKPETSEFFSPQRIYGPFRSRCKVCNSLDSAFYRRNKENRDRLVANKRRWYEENRDYALAYGRRYRQDNPEEHRARATTWKQKNAHRNREYERKRNAARKVAGGSHSWAVVLQMYDDQQGLCAYCETPLFGDFHVDHMTPLKFGGSNGWENIAITCPSCNCSKRHKTAEEYIEYRR